MREWKRNLIVMAALACTAAQGAEEPFNVDCFFGWGGWYRPMEWTAVEVGITSQLQEPFGGTLHVSVPQDDLNRLNVTHRFTVAPDLPTHLPMVTKIAYEADRCNLRITDERGKTVWRRDQILLVGGGRGNAGKQLEQHDLLIGLVGKRGFGLFRLPKETICIGPKVYNSERGVVYLEEKLPRVVPWDWTGFASLDCLILYDVDLSDFRPDQLTAMAQWVSNGGRLLMVLGGKTVDSGGILAQFLPFDLQSPREVEIATTPLDRLGLNPRQALPVTCQFPQVPPHLLAGQAGVVTHEESLYTIAMAGFGRVGVLAFDPDTLPTEHKSRTDAFWTTLIAQLLAAPEQQGDQDEQNRQRTIVLAAEAGEEDETANRRYGRYHELGVSQEWTSSVLSYLHSIEEMRPLSIWWIILLLSLLAILLGPVDYLVLKRLGKLPWTWVTCAFWIALFTGGAYYGVHYLRSGDLQYRSVSVIDALEGGPMAWQTTYSGIFAPRSERYTLAELENNQWWSAASPIKSRVFYGGSRGSRELSCVQQDGSNLPHGIPINIWTMQYLLTESVVSPLPFSASVRASGRDLEVTLDNRSGYAISNFFVLIGSFQSPGLGGVPPGEEKTLTGRLMSRRRRQSPVLSQDQIFAATGAAGRTRGIEHYLDRGAAVVCVEFAGMPLPWTMTDSECRYTPIQLARLVVFPDKTDDKTEEP